MPIFRVPHLSVLLAAGAVMLAAFSFSSQPFFASLDQFVLVAEKGIHLAEGAQVSSGDLAANEEITVAANNIVSSNLFSDQIKIAENTRINGNASFNKLQLAPSSSILGSTSTPISLPIIKLPEIPDFYTGEQNLTITRDQSINPGNFNNIEVKPNAALTLTPGTYNLNKLELRENSRLLFSGPTTLNLKEEFKTGQRALIAQTTDIAPTDLAVNFLGSKPVTTGADSFVSFKLVAPKSRAHLGERTTFRGQILAEEIDVGEGSILSLGTSLIFTSNPANVIESVAGPIFIVNEILLDLTQDATIVDANAIASSVNGKILGFIEAINMYQLQVPTFSEAELESLVQSLETSANPKIERVLPNFIYSQNL